MIIRQLIVHTNDWSDLSPTDAQNRTRFSCEEIFPPSNGKGRVKPSKAYRGVYRLNWPHRKSTKVYEWRFAGSASGKAFKVWESKVETESINTSRNSNNEFLSVAWRFV